MNFPVISSQQEVIYCNCGSLDFLHTQEIQTAGIVLSKCLNSLAYVARVFFLTSKVGKIVIAKVDIMGDVQNFCFLFLKLFFHLCYDYT